MSGLDVLARDYDTSNLIANTTQAMLTQGLARSPILAPFQNNPKTPFLLRSRMVDSDLMYVQVHISSSMTRRSDWKLKSADI